MLNAISVIVGENSNLKIIWNGIKCNVNKSLTLNLHLTFELHSSRVTANTYSCIQTKSAVLTSMPII